MDKLNIAMIGYGIMGRAHSNAWRQMRSFFDAPYEPVLKVICGRNETEVKRVADRFQWQEHATDWCEGVNRSDIHIIDICSPGHTHAPIAVAAPQAAKIIFCEKPLANSLPEAEEMLKAAQDHGCVHMICHNYRRAPAVTLARQMIEAGEPGTIYTHRRPSLPGRVRHP